jgi:hypothetical protein
MKNAQQQNNPGLWINQFRYGVAICQQRTRKQRFLIRMHGIDKAGWLYCSLDEDSDARWPKRRAFPVKIRCAQKDRNLFALLQGYLMTDTRAGNSELLKIRLQHIGIFEGVREWSACNLDMRELLQMNWKGGMVDSPRIV